MRMTRIGWAMILMAALTTTALAQPKRERQTPTRAAKERTTPTGTNLSAAQQQNLNKLKTDLQGIKQGSQATPAQKDALKNSLLAIADGATKPDPALVQQLSSDLTQALADGKLSAKEQIQLANDLKQVMNSANIPQAEVQQAIADAQAILTAAGVTQAEVQAVVKDLQAIAAEAQKNAQNAAGKVNPQKQEREPKKRPGPKK